MLEAIRIQNYKSIHDLRLNLGRLNVFIGENGCGKSNILEAIALSAAAESRKLDNEFLSSRGVRVTYPDLMRSNFKTQDALKTITTTLSFSDIEENKTYTLNNDNKAYSKWEANYDPDIFDIISDMRKAKIKKDSYKYIESITKLSSINLSDDFMKFIIFSPENSALRNFYKEGQVEPLGINGEGLFKLLKVLNDEHPNEFNIIKAQLKLFNWYDSLSIPSGISPQDDRIQIKDKYLINEFDQRSANEGFLFVLFYIALIVSPDTPACFAVDNIDASLNPKLCTEIIRVLARLAEKYDKQMLLTTHNPAILDGINLGDSAQKLYVISRNKKGYTRAKEITVKNKPVSSDSEPLKLSEAMLRGYLGGLPKHF